MNTTEIQVDALTDPLDHLVVEMAPPNAYSAVGAVLYQVGGQPFDPLDIHRPLTDAQREALTKRVVPRQRIARSRYLTAVVVDDMSALELPPHLRPKLVLALRLSQFLAGGLLLEDQSVLGPDRAGRAAAIAWMAENAGTRLVDPSLPELPDPRLAIDPVGTFTIGYLGATRRYLDQSLIHQAVNEWNRDAQITLPEGDRLREHKFAVELSVAVASHPWLPADMTMPGESVTSSALVKDLTATAASHLISEFRAIQAPTHRIVQTLRLLGYLNPSGNRVWNRSILADVEHG